MAKYLHFLKAKKGENIFKNAYFGKAYKTRDGRKAIYISRESVYPFRHALSLGGVSYAIYKDNGKYDMLVQLDNYQADIVSEWQEEIDKEHLDDLAYDYNEERQHNYWWEDNYTVCACEASEVRKAFEAGYKAAMNER